MDRVDMQSFSDTAWSRLDSQCRKMHEYCSTHVTGHEPQCTICIPVETNNKTPSSRNLAERFSIRSGHPRGSWAWDRNARVPRGAFILHWKFKLYERENIFLRQRTREKRHHSRVLGVSGHLHHETKGPAKAAGIRRPRVRACRWTRATSIGREGANTRGCYNHSIPSIGRRSTLQTVGFITQAPFPCAMCPLQDFF